MLSLFKIQMKRLNGLLENSIIDKNNFFIQVQLVVNELADQNLFHFKCSPTIFSRCFRARCTLTFTFDSLMPMMSAISE